MIHGPVTGGDHGWAFGRPLFDLAEHGYVEEEFFLSGDATTYRPVEGTEWGRDGRWRAEPSGTRPFTTRLLVYRPADPQRFNGTSVVSWNNVTAGYELFHGESPEILAGGYAFVGATVQRVGVHGFAAAPQGLAVWDPQRYGTLDIPTDECSYDIFSQVGRAVGANRDRDGVDPLGGLDVQRVIATGASQSAGRLATYVNAIHPLGRVFDGFILQIYFGAGTPLVGGDITVAPAASTGPARLPRGVNLLRELDVPVMVVNSELEAIACHAVRQPDTERHVTWESAGTTHVAWQSQGPRNLKYEREFGVAPPPPDERMNRIAITPLYDAALHHMNRWAAGGPPAPGQPLIEFTGEEPAVVRDQHGIARGGIRLPQVEAPVATNCSVPLSTDFIGALRGSNQPFTPEQLDDLYGDEAGYLAQFEEAAKRAVDAGVLLPRDVEPAVAEAAAEYRRARYSSG